MVPSCSSGRGMPNPGSRRAELSRSIRPRTRSQMAAVSGTPCTNNVVMPGVLAAPTLRRMVTQERKLVTEVPGPRSREMLARRTAAVPPGVGTILPAFVERAEGAILVDVDGNQLIDMGAGIAVMSVGHSHPDVVAATRAQLDRFSHTCFMVTPYEGYVAVAEALDRLTPGDHEKRTCLFTSGAEAVENAVKIARRHTGRDSVVVFDHAYHGRTNLTMAMTAKNA